MSNAINELAVVGWSRWHRAISSVNNVQHLDCYANQHMHTLSDTITMHINAYIPTPTQPHATHICIRSAMHITYVMASSICCYLGTPSLRSVRSSSATSVR